MSSEVTQNRVRISHSQINSFLTCAYKWHLQYRQGLRVISTDVAPATLGEIVHLGLAEALRKVTEWRSEYYPVGYDHVRTAINDTIDAWDFENRPADKTSIVALEDGVISTVPDAEFYAQWDEMVANAKAIALRTLQNLQLLEKYEVVTLDGEPLVEYWLQEDIADTGFTFAGVVDAVLYNRTTGLTEVIDWKVRRSFTGIEAEQLNSQIGLYQYVLQQRGINAQVGVVYQVKSEAPKQPKLNKDEKSMSRQKIITDWATYEAALIAAGLDPADYTDMWEKLSEVEFFRPLMVIRTERVTSVLWSNMVSHAYRINDERRFPRSYGYPCRFCPFKDWCNSELYGYDTSELLGTQYEIADWVNEVEEESEVSE